MTFEYDYDNLSEKLPITSINTTIDTHEILLHKLTIAHAKANRLGLRDAVSIISSDILNVLNTLTFLKRIRTSRIKQDTLNQLFI